MTVTLGWSLFGLAIFTVAMGRFAYAHYMSSSLGKDWIVWFALVVVGFEFPFYEAVRTDSPAREIMSVTHVKKNPIDRSFVMANDMREVTQEMVKRIEDTRRKIELENARKLVADANGNTNGRDGD